jgi:kynurenine 3-monooxygenase
MKGANCPVLIESVMADTIPMRGRMIHGKKASNELYEEAQDYDIHGRVIIACLLLTAMCLCYLEHICR